MLYFCQSSFNGSSDCDAVQFCKVLLRHSRIIWSDNCVCMLLFGSLCSAHGFGRICRQEIVVVNEIALQYTKNLFFLTENIQHEAENNVHLHFN